jgi:hypothetical protein
MSNVLRIVLLIITLIYLFNIIKSIKSKKLQLSFSVFWLILGIIMCFAIIFPFVIENIANILGFEISSNMVFFVAIFLQTYLIFNLTIKLSKENQKNRLLIQEISLINKKIDYLNKKIDEK